MTGINRKRHLIAVSAVILLAGLFGCKGHMPHAFTWPAGGDVQYTHASPPEGGYYSNWDPYAVELEVVPLEDLNPVQTQHVFIATVKDKDGKPLPNRRIEWMISEGSVGHIVEVDESGWRASRGYKVSNTLAVSHTNNGPHILDRGNDDPSDDVELTKGQTWCVITSPIEGDTYMTVYAPGINDWDKHKVFAVKHWYDVKWDFPPPATNPTGTTHDFTTIVTQYSDGMPLEGYLVTYKILDGPAGSLSPGGGQTATVTTDANGMATVTLSQATPAGGTNNLEIDIVRPENVQCCIPPVHIATGHTAKTWIPPQIAITKTAPAQKMVGETFQYNIQVTNPSSVTATNVVVTDVLPDGIAYASSAPSAQVSGQSLSWSLGSLDGGASKNITVTVSGTRTGEFTNCAEVTADQGLNARDCAKTIIVEARLQLEKTCTAEVTVCDPIEHVIIVRNVGDGPATNVKIVDNLPDGLVTTDGRSQIVFDAGTLNPGQAKQGRFQTQPQRTGTFVNRAVATADGGLTAEAECQTIVRQPVLAVNKTAPAKRYLGRPANYEITVMNTGDTAAQQTVLTDTVPAGMQFVSASDGGQFSGGRVTWNLGTLNAGASKTVTITLNATAAGTMHNTAVAKAICAEAEDSADMLVEGVPAILLEVVDVSDPIEIGANETYIITVTNQGTAADTNIRLVCTVPPEAEFVSAEGPTGGTADGRVVTFAPLSSLAPKAKATFRVVTKGITAADTRFKVSMTSDELTSPVEETESTHVY